jgi:hypothetical protein
MKKRLQQKRLKQALDKPYLCEVELPKGYEDHYPFKNGETVLMRGEIEQMPGHVAVVTKDGLVRWGYHIENFRKLTREEA